MGLENPTHWIPIIVVLLLIFGARRLPEIGRSLGAGMREFKQSVTGESRPDQQQPQQPALPPTAAPAQQDTQQNAQAQPAPAAAAPASEAQDAFAQREPAAGDRG